MKSQPRTLILTKFKFRVIFDMMSRKKKLVNEFPLNRLNDKVYIHRSKNAPSHTHVVCKGEIFTFIEYFVQIIGMIRRKGIKGTK